MILLNLFDYIAAHVEASSYYYCSIDTQHLTPRQYCDHVIFGSKWLMPPWNAQSTCPAVETGCPESQTEQCKMQIMTNLFISNVYKDLYTMSVVDSTVRGQYDISRRRT